MKMRKILVVVDMQKDFIDGALGTKEAEAIVAPVIEKMKSYAKAGIYATRDTHGRDYLKTAEGKKLPVAHCIQGTEGWMLHPEVEALVEASHVVDKPTFGSLDLALRLNQKGQKEALEIEVVGLCTDICVVSNALLFKAFMPETPISVDASCCAGVTPKSHEAALATMQMCQIEVAGK